MRYHYKLKNLPFEFKPFEVEIPFVPPPGSAVENKIPASKTEEFNPEFLQWVHDNGIIINEGRYFESTPTAVYDLHRDTVSLLNLDNLQILKFNFIFDSHGSEMKWYSTNEGYNGYVYTNTNNVRIRGYKVDECKEIYSAQTNEHCMITGGVIHTLLNSENNGVNRRCYSYMTYLPWDIAVKQFSYFLE
jgi:hypothetical protein